VAVPRAPAARRPSVVSSPEHTSVCC
jgi:hypothetical protein